MVDEVVEQRRREVERADPLLLDQAQGLSRVPARLRHKASSDEVHREKRVDPHRVVQRHHAERAVAPRVPVLERLRPAARAVCGMRAGDALRPAGRAGGVEQERELALVAVEGSRVLGPIRQRVDVPDHDPRAAVCEAVVELRRRQPPREGDEHRAGPLRGPVEERRLEPVVEDDCHPRTGLDAEPARDPPHAVEELAVADAGERLDLRVALTCGIERTGEVHARPPPACVDSTQASIASMIGV